jgi:methionyl-tRNA formyltransferase
MFTFPSSQAPVPVYLVAGCKPWNQRVFAERLRDQPGDWRFVGSRDELTVERVAELRPRYIFFLHWSWMVPAEILAAAECVCFHMTDVPYGRGGSPLQNLIARGHRETKLTALRMTAELDAGPVYLKAPLSLEGGAEEIYIRAAELSAELAATIARLCPEPQPQAGEPVVFKRRRPEESRMPALPDLPALHDFIRMLDADGYPRAYLEHAGFRYEFSRVTRYEGRLQADVTITSSTPD